MADQLNDEQANEWMNKLNLKPHTEGGFYSETYRSNDQCTLERYNKQINVQQKFIIYLNFRNHQKVIFIV
jgi:predicted cupin superfamily sugar epimerase